MTDADGEMASVGGSRQESASRSGTNHEPEMSEGPAPGGTGAAPIRATSGVREVPESLAVPKTPWLHDGPTAEGCPDEVDPVRRGTPIRLDEPNVTLPTLTMLLLGLLAPAAVAGLWAAAGAIFNRPGWGIAGAAAAAVVSVSAILSTLATVPWIPKPVSTTGLAWMAGSALRGLLSIAGGFLLYSAPPFGWSEDLAKGATPFLLSVATAWFVALLAEVAVIARHVLRATDTAGPPRPAAGDSPGPHPGPTAQRR